jgi:hypothetical protein
MTDTDKSTPELQPFVVVVQRLVEYFIPIAALTADGAKRIAEQTVANGFGDEYANECEINEDETTADLADDDQRRIYKFTDGDDQEHTF